jgi:hypothetical protein
MDKLSSPLPAQKAATTALDKVQVITTKPLIGIPPSNTAAIASKSRRVTRGWLASRKRANL